MTDAVALSRAYRILGLNPGVSPLMARRRYRDLVKKWHPDRCPADAQSQTEATRRTQEVNEAYQIIKHAALYHEVPLRHSRPSPQPPASTATNLNVQTTLDRVIACVAGILLGFVVDFGLLSNSAIVWICVPVALGLLAATFGWRVIEWIIRILWWFV